MKKKLRLNVEELKVEAFATADGAAKQGTVHGHDNTIYCGPTHEEECTRDGNSCSGPYPCLCPESGYNNTNCC